MLKMEKKMPSNAALAKIHIAKKELNIAEEDYRSILSGFNVDSAKELNDDQANKLVLLFKKIGWSPKASQKKIKETKPICVTVPANRPDEYATQKQINKLAGLWVTYSNQKNTNSFIKFILRVAKVNAIEWLQKDDVQKVIKAIEALKQSPACSPQSTTNEQEKK